MTSRHEEDGQAFGRQPIGRDGSRNSGLSGWKQWPPGTLEVGPWVYRYNEDFQDCELDDFQQGVDEWDLDREEYVSDRKRLERRS